MTLQGLGARAAALQLAERIADPDEAGRVLAAGDRAEHAAHVAIAARALRQTMIAGHPYAALPHRLACTELDVAELHAELDHVGAPPRCMATWRPTGGHARPGVDLLVCLLEHPHPAGPATVHGWVGHEYAAGMLHDQVDAVARIERRFAAARAELAARG